MPTSARCCARRRLRRGRTGGGVDRVLRFLELRHKIELHNLTGRVVECPLDELNWPRMSVDAQVWIPPTNAEIEALFARWRRELDECRKFASAWAARGA